MGKKIPRYLQPYLWSVSVHHLDPQDDKIYIIHQLLAYGDTRALAWLRRAYPSKELNKTFLAHPMKIYRPAAFYFAARTFLNLPRTPQSKHYVAAPLAPAH